jgi:hypothetical protein
VRWILVSLLLAVTGCGQSAGDDGERVPAAELPAGEWTRLENSPLSPRQGPATAYVGGDVVFVGGYSGQPCPPGADCAYPRQAVERDGAAYDPGAATWRQIADAPRRIPEGSPTAVIGDDLYVRADQALLVWHSVADRWEEVRTPRPLGWSDLVADGTRLVVASGSDENGSRPDRVLETTTGGWSTLPEDPFKPAFDRTITSTPDGLVLTAAAIGPDGSPVDPSLVQAAVLPVGERTWRALPTSDQLGGWRWSWTGHRLVEPTLGGADGGETNNYGRVIPFGGRLDPATGTWSALPDAPDQGSGGWQVEAPGGPLMAAEGWVYDDTRGSWARLRRPPGAPDEPGSAVWADDVLLVQGGSDWNDLDAWEVHKPADVWSTGLWAYRAG